MGRKLRVILLFVLCCAAVAGTAFAPSATKAQRDRGLVVTGTVVGIGGRYARSYPLTLRVNRYTSPSEVQTLNDALQRGGQDTLLDALDDMEAGRIAIGNNVGVSANVVVSSPEAGGGSRIIVLFERSVNFYELRRGARSADYRVGYAEIFIDRSGRGEGTFIPAAKVRLRDGNTWEVEDFGIFPARIMGVRARGSVPAR